VEKWVSPRKIKGFLLTGAVDKFDGFPQTENLKKIRKFFHSFSFHIPQPLWISHKQELIFAVMSRMWFCREVSPVARAASIFLMEYKMVV